MKGDKGAEVKSTANIHGIIDVKHGVRCKVQGADKGADSQGTVNTLGI